ncbi:hypothetical protein CLAFUW4_04276 [Fulvia fulva]|uniref:Uncharacterized protein n=1 Tax=Passalora fulva TaxID=5499 RepID=A0A9Q8P7I9_PASFU|nr:uncharacterized protein CLAFUR5_04241 [Fulvia fulva]KAK4626853.1 hypothetical protein CLAFUR4_04262 [Fulvia fulva]KAK4628324.1 hypothetical protein CLAFUR0_04264 [Fulvia fulva]UJO16169.1 hypothetical protein CLAFUR5_04241 [Fulvia fulva]WPV13720.1 hypothetical protein CLAFUW4_04276 [Fulvia fulva]WPV29004.1 hypothetical protein CLAFUW7_04265 [Fulvia fulva]
MLTRPPSRVNLSAADITDFERRWAARRPVRPSRPPPANARLSVGAAQLTKLGYVPASANLGRKRAESCSSQATICTIADDEAIHSGDEHSPDPLLSPTRPLSERASIRLDHAVGRDTISIADSIEPTSPRRRSPQKLPAHFTIHEEDTLDQAETEARHLRNPQIFRMAVADDICDRLATFAPELVRSTAEVAGIAEQQLDADTVLNPSLDAEAPVFVPRARFGTVANDLPDDSHGGIGHDGANSSSTQAPPTHLRVQSSFERNSQRSSQQSERDNASSSRTETLPPVRLVQSRRRSRTQDQNAAIQRTVPDLDRYPTMPPLPHVVALVRIKWSTNDLGWPK